MRTLISLLGILFIFAGIGVLAYHGYSYNTQEKIAEIGNMQITQQQTKSVTFPPMLGGLGIVVGLGLVLIGRRK